MLRNTRFRTNIAIARYQPAIAESLLSENWMASRASLDLLSICWMSLDARPDPVRSFHPSPDT
jgi:hypothetical protein